MAAAIPRHTQSTPPPGIFTYRASRTYTFVISLSKWIDTFAIPYVNRMNHAHAAAVFLSRYNDS